jgi:hypothetical protein
MNHRSNIGRATGSSNQLIAAIWQEGPEFRKRAVTVILGA